MEKWQEKYKAKICSPDEAIQKIKSAKRISFGHICSESSVLTEALIRNKKLFKKLEIDHLLSIGKCEYAKEENSEYFHHNALFIGPKTREAANSSYGDYTPIFFYETAKIFGKDGDLSPDAMLLQVSTPDEHGYCSYGLSCDYTKSATESAKIVVAQINKFVPRTLGNCFIHIDNIDYIILEDTPIPEIPTPVVGELEEKIGANCASLINDGDTLQLGIGAIPFAVLNFLKKKKDLGIHSEMVSDGIVDLIKAGVITNKKKNFNPNKVIATFLLGTKKLYDYANNNPAIELHPVDYVNNPMIIAQNNNMISINSAIQVDFVRGATMSNGGKSIIALPSTTADEKISRIVFTFEEGVPVTTSRNDVDYIITEYGIAHLKGKTLRERAKLLIEIAHPKFREELRKRAIEKFEIL